MRWLNLAKSIALMGALAVVLAGASASATTITGATVFSTDASGNFASGQLWNTFGGDGAYNVYIADGGPAGTFLNSGNGASTAPSINLTIGTHTFGIMGEPGLVVSHFGLNLFFDASNAAGISVFAPSRTGVAVPGISANGGVSTGGNLAFLNLIPGAGTLSVQAGGMNVTLTDYYWANPGVVSQDRVSPMSTNASGQSDRVGEFTLSVTAIPEPKTSLLLGLGLVAISAVRCRGKARAGWQRRIRLASGS